MCLFRPFTIGDVLVDSVKPDRLTDGIFLDPEPDAHPHDRPVGPDDARLELFLEPGVLSPDCFPDGFFNKMGIIRVNEALSKILCGNPVTAGLIRRRADHRVVLVVEKKCLRSDIEFEVAHAGCTQGFLVHPAEQA